MNPNNLQKQLRRYFRQINRQLPCPRQERKRFLASLKDDVAAYREELPECTMEDILEQFGSVADAIDTYVSGETTLTFIKKRRRLQIMAVVLTFCLVICVILFIDSIYYSRNHTVTKITIHTEIEK